MKIKFLICLILLINQLNLGESWIRVRNKGGYIARFFVDYYPRDPPSKSPIVRTSRLIRSFEKSLTSGNYPVGRTKILDVPRDAESARLRVERFIFYPFFGWEWKEIFRLDFPPQDKMCFDIWGTTAHPRWTPINC